MPCHINNATWPFRTVAHIIIGTQVVCRVCGSASGKYHVGTLFTCFHMIIVDARHVHDTVHDSCVVRGKCYGQHVKAIVALRRAHARACAAKEHAVAANVFCTTPVVYRGVFQPWG